MSKPSPELKVCPLYQNGLCGGPFARKGDIKPSRAVINPKAREKNFPPNIVPLKCIARLKGPLGELAGPDVAAQARCEMPQRVR